MLSRANDSGNFSVGLAQKVNSTGNKASDFFEVGFVDVFNNVSGKASYCISELIFELMEAQFPYT